MKDGKNDLNCVNENDSVNNIYSMD